MPCVACVSAINVPFDYVYLFVLCLLHCLCRFLVVTTVVYDAAVSRFIDPFISICLWILLKSFFCLRLGTNISSILFSQCLINAILCMFVIQSRHYY